MELLFGNNECDPECNNAECMGYDYGSTTFNNPKTATKDDGKEYAADSTNCLYNVSAEEYPSCTESDAAESPYIDENVPEEDYTLCDATWIGMTVSITSSKVFHIVFTLV